jgi:hypothetical protein
MSGFEVLGKNLKDPLKIKFDPNHMNAELPIFDGNYTIKGKTVNCLEGSFDIPDLIFDGKPPAVRGRP